MKAKKRIRMLLRKALTDAAPAEPVCRHFGTCGGCDLQMYQYADQVRAKAAVLESLIEHFRLKDILRDTPRESVASPSPYQYRQRMDYVFAFGKAGLRRKNSHREVVALEECHLIGHDAFEAFRRAHELAVQNGLESYDYMAHEGYLRYFVVRRTRGGQVLVSLVTKSEEHAETIEAIARTLLDESRARSVHWLLQDGLADLSFGRSLRHFGEPCIEERFFGGTFGIGPNTFFQSNPEVAERAYERIVDFVRGSGAADALDLYCGTGVIAILLARHVGSVTGVESDTQNLAIAEQNRTRNAADNVRFVTRDVADYLKETRRLTDCVVVNPPRAGIGEKVVGRLKHLAPPAIAYLSCNPMTLLPDLASLSDRYRIESLTLFDMFPQTRHFETLALLTQR